MQKVKVCVVDDCVDEAEVLCDGLRLNGYEAVAAYDGRSALARCATDNIDLLLLDVGLPDIEGYEVCRQLKANPETTGIPIIFVTARGSNNDVSLGYRLGASGYIVKPYNLPFVMVHVDTALRTQAANSDLPLPLNEMQDATYTDSLTGLKNRRFLRERLQEEIEKARRYGYSLSCLLLDIEEVTPLNEMGDVVIFDDLLTEVAMALRNSTRSFDILARYDGQLFAAVLAHVSREDALNYAHKMAEEVRAATMHDPCCPMDTRIAIGLATCNGDGHPCDADDILKEAMKDLLRAKSLSTPF